MQIMLNRRRLGFGAMTGYLYYLSSSCSASDFFRTVHTGLSSFFTRIGALNLFIIGLILVARYSRLNGFASASLNQLWISAIVNCLFFSLKLITFSRLLIASARNLIRLRKLAIIEFRSDHVTTTPDQLEMKIHYVEHMNNVCLICLDKLTDIDIDIDDRHEFISHNSHKDKMILLDCGHVFHYSCFKEWFLSSGSCPYCRRKV
ncbi:DEKNAAC102435 [Brettanomyces naardenensis]|uniref:DEKNAAC102435 n=1 Tax=Brettanomyces naardenensis TaxID=13370 RepID=A0A448YL85_BRENA|nr:DEKNAAC102435 [Brettanomyces naardenensis]